MNLIARNGAASARIFPAITEQFYRPDLSVDTPSPDRLPGRRLLKLSNNKIKPWRRLFKLKDDFDLFVRLMCAHRMAFEAEAQGQFQRADYFWKSAYSELTPLLADASRWEHVFKSLSRDCQPTEMADPERARFIFVREVLLDVHIAFYNGEAQSEPLVDRAFAHLDYAAALLGAAGLTKNEAYELLAPGLHERQRLCSDAGNWPEAVSACWLLLSYAPDSDPYADALADLYTAYAISGKGDQTDDGSALHWAIECLEKMTRDFPRCLRAYQALGQLYKKLSETLGADKQLSIALLAAYKAQAFDPALSEVQAVCDKLIERIKNMQQEAGALCLLSSSEVDSDSYLAASRARSKALRAFVPSEEYLASREAREAQYGHRLARACRLWRNMGLAAPEDEGGEVELHLLEAAEELARSAATGEMSLEARYRTLADNDSLLADLDADVVCSYVARHGADVIPLQLPVVVAPDPNPPRLKVKQAGKQSAAEPPAYWFFSRKDLRLKAQMILAIILVLTGSVFGLRERSARSTRDQAFLRMLQSVDRQQHRDVIEAAEEFFANLPPVGEDARRQSVFDYYDQALVRWIIESGDQDKAHMEEHLKRYKQLSESIKQEER